MIQLDLPTPPSVNRTRKVNWATMPLVRAWKAAADGLTMMAWAGGKRPRPITGPFEVTVILSESSRGDLDNLPKIVVDYARRLGLVADDSPRFMRRITIEFGEAPEGCRVILKPWKDPCDG